MQSAWKKNKEKRKRDVLADKRGKESAISRRSREAKTVARCFGDGGGSDAVHGPAPERMFTYDSTEEGSEDKQIGWRMRLFLEALSGIDAFVHTFYILIMEPLGKGALFMQDLLVCHLCLRRCRWTSRVSRASLQYLPLFTLIALPGLRED